MARTAKTRLVMELLKTDGKNANPTLSQPCAKASTGTKPLFPEAQHNPSLRIATIDGSKTRYTWNYGSRQLLNIMTMLINDELGTVLERFNVCECEKCCKFITQTALDELPAVFVQAKSKADEQKVNAELNKYRPTVIKALTKIVISIKNNPIHSTQRYGNL